MKALLSLALLLLLSSCGLYTLDNEVKKDLVDEESRLVIISFISPDSSVEVQLFQTLPLFNTTRASGEPPYVHVATAEVTIDDGSGQTVIPYFGDEQIYRLRPDEYSINPGASYLLSVTANSGLQATAKCTVPSEAAIATNATYRFTSGEFSRDIELRFEWQDISDVINYYRISSQTEIIFQNPFGGSQDTTRLRQFAIEVFTDFDRDGERVVEGVDIPGIFSNQFEIEQLKVNAFLLTTDEHYYKYHQSIQNFVFDDPFAEPTRVYTNVEGGYGIFGSYLVHNREFELE